MFWFFFYYHGEGDIVNMLALIATSQLKIVVQEMQQVQGLDNQRQYLFQWRRWRKLDLEVHGSLTRQHGYMLAWFGLTSKATHWSQILPTREAMHHNPLSIRGKNYADQAVVGGLLVHRPSSDNKAPGASPWQLHTVRWVWASTGCLV